MKAENLRQTFEEGTAQGFPAAGRLLHSLDEREGREVMAPVEHPKRRAAECERDESEPCRGAQGQPRVFEEEVESGHREVGEHQPIAPEGETGDAADRDEGPRPAARGERLEDEAKREPEDRRTEDQRLGVTPARRDRVEQHERWSERCEPQGHDRGRAARAARGERVQRKGEQNEPGNQADREDELVVAEQSEERGDDQCLESTHVVLAPVERVEVAPQGVARFERDDGIVAVRVPDEGAGQVDTDADSHGDAEQRGGMQGD